MLLIGRIVQSSSLNSFSSICYCLFTLGVHAYACYTAIDRYREAESRAWPGGGGRSGPPVESGTMLGLTILSLVLMPLFCFTCVLKVGNLANDGVKLGRDHALGCASDTTKDCSTRSRGLRRLWKIACPVSQTIHVIAAFLILLPETLLTAAEIKYGYKSTGEAWRTDMDFLYPPERAFYSEIRSTVNAALAKNASHVRLESPHLYVTAWGERAFYVHVSIAFANFCFALGCFLVRYASVFWYTNKPLTAVFALQLLAMVFTSIFSFCSFSTLYCVSCNQRLYPNVSLSLRCGAVLVLYLVGSTVLLASTVTVFEYGCHYFHEKFEVVSRHRETESYVKRTLISNNGCQGYVPHLCAMAALILSAVCKGPLLYDLVNLMRLTDDEMLLAGIVSEVCYMILWLALWFCLTLKQQWQFRILDYVALRPPPSVVSEDSVRSAQQMDRGDGVMVDSLTRTRRLSGRENFPQRFLEPGQAGTNSSCEEPCPSDIGTDESDGITSAAEMVLDLDGKPIPDRNSSFSRSRNRRAGGQRVTFDESVRSKGSSDGAQNANSSAIQQAKAPEPLRPEENNSMKVAQLNVAADVHSSSGATSSSASNESTSQGVVVRPKNIGAGGDIVVLSREYRNSIRNKCGEIYSSANNLSSSFEETTGEEFSPPEPLPTLMSSFRDKVRESSIAASNFKERERHMLEQFDYLDPHPPPAAVLEDISHSETENRRCVAVKDEADSDMTNSLDRRGRDVSKYPIDCFSPGNEHGFHNNLVNGRYRPRSKSYDQSKNGSGGGRLENTLSAGPYDFKKGVNSSSLPRSKAAAHNSSVSSDEGHRSSFSNSTHESSDLSLSIPPAMEDLQRGRLRLGSGFDNRRSLRDDYLHHHQQHLQHTQQQHLQHPLHNAMVGGTKDHLVLNPRPLQVLLTKEGEVRRRDSANYSLTSSQETSSNESDQGQELCSQV